MIRIQSRADCLRFALRSSALLLLLCFLGSPSSLLADWRDDVGYTKLIELLGSSAPDGSGVPISLVEAGTGVDEAYFPDVNNSEFSSASDPLGVAVTFIDGSGDQGNGISSHAHFVARRFFGNASSISPAVDTVTVYEANDYLNNVLNVTGSNTRVPDAQDFRVQNFSWIGTFANSDPPTSTELNNTREALRRFDYAVDADNITAFVGLHNNSTELDHFFSHSYNAISVGVTSGSHSTGLTHLGDYGIGRSKPEIVVNAGTTSTATASASTAATFLHSASTVLGTDAVNSQTMKALILAGAVKEGLSSWSQIDEEENWHPLDDTFGAGELNVYNSYLITEGGQAIGSTVTPPTVPSHGWDYQTVQSGSGNEVLYDFVVPTGSTATELSIVLTWNAEISAPFHVGDPVVADLKLELVDSFGMTVDSNLADSFVDGISDSDVDNVEHLYLQDLAAGTYTLKVSSDDLAVEYGLAWRTDTLLDVISADFDEDGAVDGADFLAWQRGYRTLVGADHSDGDADGDGDVDADDLSYFQVAAFAGDPPELNMFLHAVPEPTSLLLAGIALLFAHGLRRRFSV